MGLVSGAVKEMGRKTSTDVKTEAIIGARTCTTERMIRSRRCALSRIGASSARKRWIFSITTIEESMIIPTARAIPPREIRFSVTLKKYISIKDSTRVTGREMPEDCKTILKEV